MWSNEMSTNADFFAVIVSPNEVAVEDFLERALTGFFRLALPYNKKS